MYDNTSEPNNLHSVQNIATPTPVHGDVAQLRRIVQQQQQQLRQLQEQQMQMKEQLRKLQHMLQKQTMNNRSVSHE